MASFFTELKRRNVFKVGVTYAIVAWLLIEIVSTVFPMFEFPIWTSQIVTIIILIGFPIAMIFAWAFELTADGIKPTNTVDIADSITQYTGRKFDLIIIVVLALALAFVFIDNYILVMDKESVSVETVDKSTPAIDAIKEESALVDEISKPGNLSDSVAVLPFENLSVDTANEWLGRGISEDILNLLAQIDDLKIVARTSSFQESLRSLDVRDVGRLLNARFVLEGSVRRSGERLRIIAQLIDAQSGYHLWSQEYNRSTSDFFAIQGEIAERVVKALKLELPVDFQIDPVNRPTENIDAYDYYLQARSLLDKTTSGSSLKNAEQFFRRALEYDQKFGLAYAGLCSTLVRQIEAGYALDALKATEEACANASRLAPDSYNVHLAMGELYKIKGDNQAALQEFEWVLGNSADNIYARLGIAEIHAQSGENDMADRGFREAIEISPDYSLAYSAYGKFLFNQGRTEDAIRIYKLLTEMEPADMAAYNDLGSAYLLSGNFEQAAAAYREVVTHKRSALPFTNIGTSYYYLGRFTDAEIMYREAIALSPEDYSLWGNLGDALIQSHDKQDQAQVAYQQARKLAEQALKINPKQGLVLAALAHYCARLNDVDCATESISQALQLSDSAPYTHYLAALVELHFNNSDQAAEHKERAIELGFPTVLLDADPLLTPLGND
jgi:TolB-like protein/Tfp pilus assembly protein PilF